MRTKALVSAFLLITLSCKLVISATYNQLRRQSSSQLDDENDEALAEYLEEIMEGFRIAMPLGVEDLNIPPLEPAFIEERSLNYNSDATRFSIAFRNVTITGLSEFEVERLSVSVRRLQIHLKIRFPTLFADGHYHLSGVGYRILPLKGHGPWWLELHNFTMDLRVQGELTAQRRFRLLMLALVGDVVEVRSHISNLLDSGQNLSQVVNGILRTNGRRILQEVTKRLRRTLEEAISPYADLVDSSVILEFTGDNATYRSV